jgi:integrase
VIRKLAIGRTKGSENRGYFYREGRGWTATIAGRKIALRDTTGELLTDRNTAKRELNAALDRLKKVMEQPAPNTIAVSDVVNQYLAYCKKHFRKNTYDLRHRFLFDFVSGFPARFRHSDEKPGREHRIHKGYGERAIMSLTDFDVEDWTEKHSGWGEKKSARMGRSVLADCLCWAKRYKLISTNPLPAIRRGNAQPALTFIDDATRELFFKQATESFRMTMKSLIRTGARPGELCALRPEHVEITDRGMRWILPPELCKTNRERVIYCTDPEIIAYVQQRMGNSGCIFRGQRGDAWTTNGLRQYFNMIQRLWEAKGYKFPAGLRLYSCRHTFAKDTLQGKYTGKPVSIMTLSQLMGNSPRVCERYYAKYAEGYVEHLWGAV